MQFRTEIEAIEWPFTIDYQSQVAFIGSCFSNEISDRCKSFGFNVLANPFGTVYNPASIERQLQIIVGVEPNIFKHSQNHYCLDANTQFVSNNKKELANLVKKAKVESLTFLKSTNVIFITLGTAYAFSEKESGEIVANCHKLPAILFNRKLLSQEELTSSIQSINQIIRSINTDVHICYTISPVRHLSNGLVENNVSKAALRIALQGVLEQDKSVHYFPSYEIVLDDLRDYRFFAEDLSHINKQGVDYVWEKLSSVFSETCQQQIKLVKKYNQLKNHRPTNIDGHEKLLQSKKEELLKNIKGINL